MDPKDFAHKAANVAYRDSDASQQPRFKDGRPRDGPVRAASYDRAGPANMQSTSRPSNVQHPGVGTQRVSDAMFHEAVARNQKVIEEQHMTQQRVNPPLPPRIPTGKTADLPRTKLPPEGDDRDESIPDEDAFNPADLFYVIMGVTGVGKSTFISLLSEDAAEVGHDLQSKTKQVSIHRLQSPDGRKAWLIDTPGFDDTGRPNVEILKEIIASLTKLYERGGRISGMIYLHRITDPRMSGSALKTLEIFKLLTGASAMPIVRLVSTRWNEVDLMGPDLERAERHEEQLRTTDRFWGTLIREGAVTIRHIGHRQSALTVISSLLERQGAPPKLAIVREVLDEKLSLLDTATGRFIRHDNDELRKQYESEIQKLQQEQKQALEEKDHELAEMFAAEEMVSRQRREDVLAAESQLNVKFHDQPYQHSFEGEARPAGKVSSEGLRSENELLHLERTQLEEKMAKVERQHRIEMVRLQQAAAQQSAQQREESTVAMNQLAKHYQHDRYEMEDELRHLKRKNKKLKKSSTSFFDWLMISG